MLPIYEPVVRKPNVMKNRNPLAQTESKTVGLNERMRELNSYKKWQKLVEEYRAKRIKLDPKLRPIVQMVNRRGYPTGTRCQTLHQHRRHRFI